MLLKTRSAPYLIPRYSLTGDILSYQRCGRQYRYYNGSSLPPSRPVQFWTGEFVHNSLEDAYSIWNRQRDEFAFPWPMNITPFPRPEVLPQRAINDIGEIGDRVEARLTAMQKLPRSVVARISAYNRVFATINILAPHLFPLITSVEQKISGSRNLPIRMQRAEKYELFGIADVISHVEYNTHPQNKVISLLAEQIPGLDGEFDIIVDYKATRRPPISDQDSQYQHHKWQIQTYAWLRGQAANSTPIRAGLIVYINELHPTKDDLIELKRELHNGSTDVLPEVGSADYYALYRWNGREPLPQFSDDFLLRRSIRVISSSTQEANEAVHNIDAVVQEIEQCVQTEYDSGAILSTWGTNHIPEDCAACDFRRFCTPDGAEPWSVQAPG